MNPLLILLGVHFVGDFLLQSDWMAVQKSKRWDALALHVGIYAICFAWWGPWFVALTFITHFVTDAVTSRITSALWFLPLVGDGMKPNWKQVELRSTRHWFFVAIGSDQLIHATTLAYTLQWVTR